MKRTIGGLKNLNGLASFNFFSLFLFFFFCFQINYIPMKLGLEN